MKLNICIVIQIYWSCSRNKHRRSSTFNASETASLFWTLMEVLFLWQAIVRTWIWTSDTPTCLALAHSGDKQSLTDAKKESKNSSGFHFLLSDSYLSLMNCLLFILTWQDCCLVDISYVKVSCLDLSVHETKVHYIHKIIKSVHAYIRPCLNKCIYIYTFILAYQTICSSVACKRHQPMIYVKRMIFRVLVMKQKQQVRIRLSNSV